MTPALFDKAALETALADLAFGHPLVLLEETASTNDEAILRARTGAPEGTLVLAESQTAGRGRRGAAWFADPGTALLFSVVLRPPLDVAPRTSWPRLTSLAALALARAITKTTGLSPAIKWPNDLLIGSRKIAGILVEAASNSLVLGIGINVNTAASRFPPELRESATSLRAVLGEGAPLPRVPVLAAFLEELAEVYPTALRDDGFPAALGAIRPLSLLLHQEIIVFQKDSQITGIARNLGPHGELLLETAPGASLIPVTTAERVRLLRP